MLLGLPITRQLAFVRLFQPKVRDQNGALRPMTPMQNRLVTIERAPQGNNLRFYSKL